MAGVGGFGGDSRDEWASREGGGQQVGHNSVRAHADVTQRGGGRSSRSGQVHRSD
jgi:hypothetical protein